MTTETKQHAPVVLKAPIQPAVLLGIVELATRGIECTSSLLDVKKLFQQIHDMLVAPALPDNKSATPRSEHDVKTTMDELGNRCLFNRLPSVQSVLQPLVAHEPHFPDYTLMQQQHLGSTRNKSATLLAKKGQAFVTGTTIKRIKEAKDMPSELMTTKVRNTEIGSQVHDDVKQCRVHAQQLLLSSHFVCSGSLLQPHRPCAHGAGWPVDNSDGANDYCLFQFDHAIGFVHLGHVFDSISAEPDIKTSLVLRQQLYEFIRHLAFSTRRHPVYGWPPNVYIRCPGCQKHQQSGVGGTSHDKLWSKPPKKSE